MNLIKDIIMNLFGLSVPVTQARTPIHDLSFVLNGALYSIEVD